MEALSASEAEAWARMWACHMRLPNTLEATLKREADVTYYEFQAMLKIAENPNASRRMSDLSEATAMSLSHLSRVITRLEKKGFVARIPDPNDGRATFAALTPAGQRAVAAGHPGYIAELRRIFFDTLNEDELEVFSSALARINSALAGETDQAAALRRAASDSKGVA